MKKVIDGKMYDTETATSIDYMYCGECGSFQYWYEELYRKKTGEFFLYTFGGLMTRDPGSRIIPYADEEAQEWMEIHSSGELYEEVFGPVDE